MASAGQTARLSFSINGEPPRPANKPSRPPQSRHGFSSSSKTPPVLARSSSVPCAEVPNHNPLSAMPESSEVVAPDEVTPIARDTGEASRRRNYNTATSNTRGDRPTNPSNVGKNQSPDRRRSAAQEPEGDGHRPWHKRLAERYGSVSLENKGSVARDHLALERTFLAWLRTSLAFASIGIAVTQLFRLNTSIANRKGSTSEASLLPLSPLLGHDISPELVAYLQQIAASATARLPLDSVGPTLLDQLMLLSAEGQSVANLNTHFRINAVDDTAANRLRHAGRPLGATFLAVSLIVLIIGFHRYFEAQHWIIRGKFPASRGSVALVGFFAGALMVACLVVVVVISPMVTNPTK